MSAPEIADLRLGKVGAGPTSRGLADKVISAAGALAVPAGAIVASLLLFGVFLALTGVNPLEVYGSIYRGAFGSWFSWQNTLQRAAPLLLTALCTALPARFGLIVIGGEGALVIGAVATVLAAVTLGEFSRPVVLADFRRSQRRVRAGSDVCASKSGHRAVSGNR